MTNIIVPVNFSREMRASLIAYMQKILAKQPKAHFILLHACEDPQHGVALGVDIDEIMDENAKTDLDNERKEILKKIPRASISCHVGHGTLHHVVNTYEKEIEADFMIVSIKGGNMLKSLLNDSKPSKLVFNSNVPIIFLPNVDKVEIPKNIVFATDLKPFDNIPDFQRLINMANTLKAKIDFLYINTDNDDKSKQDNFDKYYAPHLKNISYNYYELDNNDISEGILQFVKDKQANGLMLIERKDSLLKRFFGANIVDNLVSLVKLPVMVISERSDT